WHDALLLEVWMQRRSRSADRVCGYSLFGRAATIEWSLLAPDSIAPEDIWYAELEQRQRELLDVIATRTRLALRTFAADLQEPEAARPPTRFSQILTFVMFGALCLLIFGGLLGLAAAALILPISNFTQLNALTAGALALASAYFVVFLVVVIAKLRRQRTFDANYPLPSLSEEAETIEEEAGLRYRARPMVRAQFIFCGLLLAWQIIPVCLAIFRPLTAPTSSQRHDLQTWVLGGLTFCTFCGLACIWAALRDHRTDIWADGEGLHERDGRRARFLPLETVQMVQVETIAGKVDAFRVTGAASVIWWPADDVRIMPPRDHDARALTPDELAAVVVTRSGRSLTVS
ncbi:MAG TPA: hypothetical protein VFU88_00095, partial [Ktedonobacterales bacterium]|nr:hypothetical protein [Ktedonobacterales bacterium]